MALYKKTRTQGEAPAEYTDKNLRAVMVDRRVFDELGNVVSGSIEMWCEWQVQVTATRTKTVSVRCDKAVEDEILALPNIPTALAKMSENTHPKAILA